MFSNLALSTYKFDLELADLEAVVVVMEVPNLAPAEVVPVAEVVAIEGVPEEEQVEEDLRLVWDHPG